MLLNQNAFDKNSFQGNIHINTKTGETFVRGVYSQEVDDKTIWKTLPSAMGLKFKFNTQSNSSQLSITIDGKNYTGSEVRYGGGEDIMIDGQNYKDLFPLGTNSSVSP